MSLHEATERARAELAALRAEMKATTNDLQALVYGREPWPEMCKRTAAFGLRNAYRGEDCESYIIKVRAHLAKARRDTLFSKAADLCVVASSLPNPPPTSEVPERDIRDSLTTWCVEAHRALNADPVRLGPNPAMLPAVRLPEPPPRRTDPPHGPKIAKQLRALGSLPGKAQVSRVYETAGQLLIHSIPLGWATPYPEIDRLLTLHDAVARPRGITTWGDVSIALRETFKLDKSSYVHSFPEDCERLAQLIEPYTNPVIGRGAQSPPAGSTVAGANAPGHSGPEIRHAPDFNWVIWFGRKYDFNKGNQAESVRVLWKAWESSGCRNGCGLSEKTIGEQIGSSNEDFRLAHVFRGHAAWGTMIRPTGQKGVFALYAPAESPQNHTS